MTNVADFWAVDNLKITVILLSVFDDMLTALVLDKCFWF